MTVNWGPLVVVAVVSLAVGVLVVVLVSLALVGLSARELGPTPVLGRVTATLCLLAASAIVLYGFYLLVF